MSADVLGAVAASATMALRAILATAAPLPGLRRRAPVPWRAARAAGVPAAPRPRRVRSEIPPRDLAQVHPEAPTLAHVAR